MLLTRPPLAPKGAFDLHVLGLPPAFALSQDQTLKLDEIFIPAGHVCAVTTLGSVVTFDEVHPLIIFRLGLAPENPNVQRCNLKRVPPKSLPKPLQQRIASPRKAARKDPAVHVSLSSDSLFKQPGNRGDSHSPMNRRAIEARASDNHRIPFHCSSEELLRRAITP